MPKQYYPPGLIDDNKPYQTDYLKSLLDEPTPEEIHAMGGGLARYLLADIPGGMVDATAQGLSVVAGGVKSLLPEDLAGYNLSEELGIDAFQESMEDPVGGHKSLERLWESLGIIPPPSDLPQEHTVRYLLRNFGMGIRPFSVGGAKKGAGFQMPVPPGAAERVTRKLKRIKTTNQKKLKNPDYREPGGPKNKLMTLQPRAGTGFPAIQVGGQTTKGWVRKIEGVLTREQIIEAYEWYRSGKMLQPFLDSVGEDLTPEIRAGMLVASQGKTPTTALGNYMRQREQVKRGIQFDDPSRKQSGTADAALYQLAQGEPITRGAGQKIYDFVDAALQKKTRTYYNNDPRAGAPFVADRHTARDEGLIDPVFMSWLKKNYKLPKGGLNIDFNAAPSETSYEFAGDQGRKITKNLVKMGWDKKYGFEELGAGEVQAIGWIAMSKLYNQPGEDIPTAIAKNIQRVSAALEFGEGSPLGKEYGERYAALPIEKQYEVTRKGLDWVSDRANELSGTLAIGRVHGSGAWMNFPQEPAMVENMLASPGGADLYASIVGYLANQSEVWAVRGVSEGAKDSNGIMIDILEVGSNEIEKGENLQAVWEKLNAFNPEVFQGYQPLVKDDQSGIRLILPFKSTVGKDIDEETGKLVLAFKTKIALRRYIDENKSKLTEVLNSVFPDEISFTIKNFDANIRFLRNDWKENENGESYLLGISERAGGRLAESLRDSHRPEFETFLQGLFSTAESTTGEETGVPRTEYTGFPPTAYQSGFAPGQLDIPQANSPPPLSPDQLRTLGLYSLLPPE